LHAEVAGEVEAEGHSAAGVGLGLHIPEAHSRVQHQIDADLLQKCAAEEPPAALEYEVHANLIPQLIIPATRPFAPRPLMDKML